MRLLWDHNDENESESPNFKMPMKTLINTSIQCTSTYLYLTGKRLFLIELMMTVVEVTVTNPFILSVTVTNPVILFFVIGLATVMEHDSHQSIYFTFCKCFGNHC